MEPRGRTSPLLQMLPTPIYSEVRHYFFNHLPQLKYNLWSEYKELATTELETLNENEEEDDDDGLNMRAIRMASAAAARK